jgi:hypothetical protein
LKALTVQQPWAELIVQGHKSIELREWKTKHRGILAIHAGKTVNTVECRRHNLDPNKLTKGAIIGTVIIDDVIEFTQKSWEKLRDQHLCDETSPGEWKGWKLENPYRLESPIPYRGFPGVFSVPVVQRITVDEILAEDLIRFEVCDLKDDVEKFLFENDVWKKDKELMINGDIYELELGIPYPWDMLKESQVFLFGRFEVIGDREDPQRFEVNLEKHDFFEIGYMDGFRDQLRKLYSEVLRVE